jgi:hypothetical protein
LLILEKAFALLLSPPMVVRSRSRAYLVEVTRSAGASSTSPPAEAMSETDPRPELEIKSDADWKRQVRQEAAELDAKRGTEHRPASEKSVSGASDSGEAEQATDAATAQAAASGESSGRSASAAQLPPADFTMLVTMFSTQAMVSLGVIPSPESGLPEQNLPLARHFIDLLGVLQEKTRRNLTGHEADLLTNSLHELRLAYVELSKPSAAKASSAPVRSDTST